MLQSRRGRRHGPGPANPLLPPARHLLPLRRHHGGECRVPAPSRGDISMWGCFGFFLNSFREIRQEWGLFAARFGVFVRYSRVPPIHYSFSPGVDAVPAASPGPRERKVASLLFSDPARGEMRGLGSFPAGEKKITISLRASPRARSQLGQRPKHAGLSSSIPN